MSWTAVDGVVASLGLHGGGGVGAVDGAVDGDVKEVQLEGSRKNQVAPEDLGAGALEVVEEAVGAFVVCADNSAFASPDPVDSSGVRDISVCSL